MDSRPTSLFQIVAKQIHYDKGHEGLAFFCPMCRPKLRIILRHSTPYKDIFDLLWEGTEWPAPRRRRNATRR